jgi:uncharacterized membrane protein YozB (DUF420 family)
MLISTSDLPTLNATLNATSALLVTLGHFFIRRENVKVHRAVMISAFVTSILFLVSYIIYHSSHGSTPFRGVGVIRPIYFVLLGSHTILAVAAVPLVIITLIRGLLGRIEKHRKIAVWTYPIWIYVSVSGVLVYLLLYQLYPGG